jgi:3-hydroxybutyryl-CoA dehydrogenase
MGAGIAQVAADNGHAVRLYDVNGQAVEKAIARIEAGLQKLVQRGRRKPCQVSNLVSRIQPCTTLSALGQCGLVIEAAVEDLEVKKQLFGEIENICGDQAILASNTSSISIDLLAEGLQRPQNFLGMHFFNPAPVMKLVEVVSGESTSKPVAERIYQLASSWGKVPVHVRNSPGFIVNRVARSFYSEPLRLVEEKAATVATIDLVFRECGGFAMGPFALMDLIGNDVNYAVTESIFNAFGGDSRFQPSELQKQLVDAGLLGRKTGHGWYDYSRDMPSEISSKNNSEAPESITVHGQLGMAASLVERAREAGIRVREQPGAGHIYIDGVVLMMTDGRTATDISAQLGEDVVLFDLVADYAAVGHIALGLAQQNGEWARDIATGFFAALGMTASVIADTPGLCLMRTVCMLANEAADAVHQQVCDVNAVDNAMRHGVNYPLGPLQWADRISPVHVKAVLNNIQAAQTKDQEHDRYRCSPLIDSKVMQNNNFYPEAASHE